MKARGLKLRRKVKRGKKGKKSRVKKKNWENE